VKSDDYVRCRALGHAWYDVEAERAPSFGYAMEFRCERCGTVRRDLVNRYGELLPGGRNYRHPDGYRDAERIERAEYRRRLLTRMTGYRGGAGRATRTLRAVGE